MTQCYENKKASIPFLGFFTKKICGIEENMKYIKQGTSLINLEKILKVHGILKDFYMMKDYKYEVKNEENGTNANNICKSKDIENNNKKDLAILENNCINLKIMDENIRTELKILQCLDPLDEEKLLNIANNLEPKFLLAEKKSYVKRFTKTEINFYVNQENMFFI